MNCPNCNHLNPKSVIFCEKCQAFLPDAIPGTPEPVADTSPEILEMAAPAAPKPAPPIPAFEDSPFGDFLPAWMMPNQTPAAATQPAAFNPPPAFTQTAPTAVAPTPATTPAPVNPRAGATASLSIEDLLDDASNAKPAAPGNAPPLPAWGNSPATPNSQPANFNRPGTAPLSDPIEGLPVPNFQMPPLWYKQAVETPWQEVKKADKNRTVPSNSVREGYNPSLAGPGTRLPSEMGPEPGAPPYGVDRGFYFFTDQTGVIVVHALAGFVRRLAAAIIDSVISAILGIILFYTVVRYFIKLDPYNMDQTLLGIGLALVILPVLFGFLYHTVLVGMSGQTLGDRMLKIKVIRRGGKAVGIISGVVRALYGLVPSIISAVLQIVLAANTPASSRSQQNLTPSIIGASITLLAALGMAWALFDKGHQGLHDKLADTYVVSVKES